jgi:hypothetical protein
VLFVCGLIAGCALALCLSRGHGCLVPSPSPPCMYPLTQTPRLPTAGTLVGVYLDSLAIVRSDQQEFVLVLEGEATLLAPVRWVSCTPGASLCARLGLPCPHSSRVFFFIRVLCEVPGLTSAWSIPFSFQ